MTKDTTRLHTETAREAGFGSISFVSIIAGVLAAYGAFAVVAAVAGAILTKIDVNTEFRTNDWTSSGAVAALISAVVLLIAYGFGGYVAGRMARRRGVFHGVAVAVVSLILGGVAGAVVRGLSSNADISNNLRGIGIPTTTSQISDVAIAGALLSLAAVLIGAIVGGILGERWHTKLARRVADPEFGTAAEERVRLEHDNAERAQRIGQDEAIRRDVAATNSVDLRDGAESRHTAAEWRERDDAARTSDIGAS